MPQFSDKDPHRLRARHPAATVIPQPPVIPGHCPSSRSHRHPRPLPVIPQPLSQLQGREHRSRDLKSPHACVSHRRRLAPRQARITDVPSSFAVIAHTHCPSSPRPPSSRSHPSSPAIARHPAAIVPTSRQGAPFKGSQITARVRKPQMETSSMAGTNHRHPFAVLHQRARTRHLSSPRPLHRHPRPLPVIPQPPSSPATVIPQPLHQL